MSAVMTAWTLGELARCVSGRMVGADRAFSSVSTDSRSLRPDALFVALKGPNFDGHEFAAAAAERGAAAALVEHPVAAGLPQLVVADVLAALSTFARAWRRRFRIPVIGVTGSNGKTTTKELINAILSPLGPTLATRGNLNNHIGVPLTLLELRAEHRYAIIEMGASRQGEIAQLASLAEPEVGIVTNAGAAHLEGFGSLDGVADGKGELLRSLPSDGVAVINADDRYAARWRNSSTAKRILSFGLEQPADFMARKVRIAGEVGSFRTDFDLATPGGSCAATLALGGLHNLRNALGAAAVACAVGATLHDIAAGLARMQSVGGRLEFKPAIHGAFIIDDSYNANPGSLRAGLDVLCGPGAFGRTPAMGTARWLVLGEMKELGANTDELHAQVGRYARDSGVERLLAIGEDARHAVDAFGEGSRWFADVGALIEAARRDLETREPGVVMLVKGSRANHLERFVAALASPAADRIRMDGVESDDESIDGTTPAGTKES
ncbi:UDP-N-acetylmuramoyl-tripeptide--D-alanyl-D-alanine ligase [Steroidobacter denitrificans]|nr:UDP-N-acetylmuramoyl-tripeptide--D-alanyl-D-alanine ligase [Steroidobacter denitrificans]